MDHQKASSKDKGLERRRPSEANVSTEVTAGGLLDFVDLTRESVARTLRPASSATWSAPAETGDRPLTLADSARIRTSSTPHQRSSAEHGEERRSSSIDQSSRSAKERSTSSRAENYMYSSTATAGSVVSASVAATAEVAGNQPAERAVHSGSQRTEEKASESTVQAAAVTTTADNDSAPGPQPVSRSAPPQATSTRGRNVSTQVMAPSTRSVGTQTKTSADGNVEESSSEGESMTPGASWPDWSSPSSADVWAMVQVMSSTGPVEIAAAARRRYQLSRATARSIRRRAATLLYGRRATMAEVRSLLPATGVDGNTSIATIHHLEDWLQRDQSSPLPQPFD